jgi:hypothetical protein
MISIKRIGLLLRRRYLLEWRSTLIQVAGVFALLFFAFLITAFNYGDLRVFHAVTYVLVLYLGGFTFTSRIFHDLVTKERACSFFTLPATIGEKFVEGLLLSTIGYFLFTTIGYYLISLLFNFIGTVFFSYEFFVWNIFSEDVPQSILGYFALQSVFFLGATIFKRNVFLKTVLAILIVVLVIGSVMGITGWLLFKDVHGEHIDPYIFNINPERFNEVASIAVQLIMAPFFWLTAYFKLKEKEV